MIGIWIAIWMTNTQSAACQCRPRIDWAEIDREIALAAMRTDLEIVIKRNREAFERGAR